MPVNLNQTGIDPGAMGLRQMMKNLQGNILKSHGREYTRHIFFSFATDTIKNKAETKKLLPFLTSSAQQLKPRTRGLSAADRKSVFGNVFLTAQGYEKLGFSRQQILSAFNESGNIKFTDGMGTARAELNDPENSIWDKTYRDSAIDAMMLLASDDISSLNKAGKAVRGIITKVGRILGEEEGRGLRDSEGRAIENFGYVDGRSQPLYLKTDLEKEQQTQDGTDVWDPSAPLSLVLVPDPFTTVADSFGSFFVFRKLEQNVKKFKDAEDQLAEDLGLRGDDAERAGAMIVGRFEDGTPLALHKSAAGHPNAENNFTYGSDPEGLRCPFQAHIRKTNPRGDTARQFGASLDEERSRRITRRGITYGTRLTKRRQDKGKVFLMLDEEKEKQLKKVPTKDVGLLFMCFQANIANQFGFMQQQWANAGNFVRANAGIDPVIGQQVGDHRYNWPTGYGEPPIGQPQTKNEPFAGAVTMKGGEFFFAPSLSFLKGLE